MNTKLLRSLFTLFCALLVATAARSAVIYSHNFNNRNFAAPTAINSNMTAVWSGIGDQPYSRDQEGPGIALFARNHVYVLTITVKERFQAEITSITFRHFSGETSTMQIKVNDVNYGNSFGSGLQMVSVNRTKTVSNLRNTFVVKVAVSNSGTVNSYSQLDDFVINGNVTSYDPATEAQPDGNGILYVDVDANAGGDGSSWDHALNKLHYATRAATMKPAIKQVWVADGTYEPEAAGTPFQLTDGVAYYGGFEGYESDQRERVPGYSPTLLKGIGGNVLSASDVGATTRFDGFTVVGGTGLTVSGEQRGGAFYLNNSTPVIVNCIFNENQTDASAATGKGGAIYLLNSGPTILQCLFTGNSAKGTSSGLGGAIYIDNASPAIRNCTFAANAVGGGSAPGNGGAIYVAGGSSPVIENCIVWNNADPASPGAVSAINGPGTPVVSYSLIQGGFTGGTNILDADPQFVEPEAGNFRQRKGSPATDAGNPATDLSLLPQNTDNTPLTLDGARRLTSVSIDLGPFEVTPSSIWYVNAANTAPAPTGASWENAFSDINDALTLASEGDQVWVARGLYEISGSYTMVHGVKYYGSFAGTETSPDQRPFPIGHGDPATSSVLIGSSSPIIDNNANGLTREDVFDGFSVGGAYGSEGGAMRNIQVSPTIANCAFLFNEVFETGGAMYNYEASPLIINTIFRENSVSFGAGGAISNRSNSSTVLVNCLLAGNTSDQLAGAIYNENAQITLLNCTISGNTQQSQGTIDTHGGSVTIRNTIIYGNNGGITSEDADVAVTYSLVEGRTASDTDHNLDGTTNPQFTGDENWTLLPCSPAVNRGASEALPDIPAIATDLAANPRIYNVQTDMGAYEMQAVPGPGTLPSGGESATLPVYAGATSITDNCKTFALIEPTGAPGALGNVTVKTFLAAGNTVSEGQKVFVKRHYDITPTGTDGPAKVTLYFSKQDFEDYNQAYGNANNASLPANLKVVQYHGTSPYGFPGTYSGPTQLITNVTVTESADHNSYEVSFQVSGFSGFFISGQSEAALPVTLVSFRAEKREHQAYLQWQTSSEINSRGFEIERSGDGRRWHHLGDVMAKGGESVVTDYSYTDPSPVTGTNMYRLKMTDADGSFAYSRIAVLDFRDETAALYPNPAVGTSEVHLKGIPENEISKVALFNASGQMLANPVWRRGTMDVSRLTAGTYMVEIARTNGDKMRFRFVVVK